jgi:hypothetical protein
MRHLGFLALIAGGVFALTACSAPAAPDVTFFADGHAVDAQPLIHCDVRVQKCQQAKNATVTLKVRPGKPVQISVPSAVAKTPWLVNVQYTNANGELQPVQQKVFTSGNTYSYTATPPAPDDQLVVVEIQQISAATPVDAATNKPITDANGNPQLVVQSIWSLQLQPGK